VAAANESGPARFPYSPYSDRRIVYLPLQSHTPSRSLHNAVKVQKVGFGAIWDFRRRAGDRRRSRIRECQHPPEIGLESLLGQSLLGQHDRRQSQGGSNAVNHLHCSAGVAIDDCCVRRAAEKNGAPKGAATPSCRTRHNMLHAFSLEGARERNPLSGVRGKLREGRVCALPFST